MELPKRKQIRLQGFDYSSNGAYFVTICTYNRERILGDIDINVGQGLCLADYPTSDELSKTKYRISQIIMLGLKLTNMSLCQTIFISLFCQNGKSRALALQLVNV
ncbi:MAG: hypothetical protein RR827_09605, partial [Oscillospiraceae bacterium]